MIKLERITTEYIDVEDRIRLTGRVENAPPMVIWVTCRLLQRLLPPLLQWLERQGPGVDAPRAEVRPGPVVDAPRAEVLQSFAQHAARAAAVPQAPVRATAESAAWLARSVDLTQLDKSVRLTFRGAEGQEATLMLPTKVLRQWLGILHDGYAKAAWPMDVWPGWLRESAPSTDQQAVVLH